MLCRRSIIFSLLFCTQSYGVWARQKYTLKIKNRLTFHRPFFISFQTSVADTSLFEQNCWASEVSFFVNQNFQKIFKKWKIFPCLENKKNPFKNIIHTCMEIVLQFVLHNFLHIKVGRREVYFTRVFKPIVIYKPIVYQYCFPHFHHNIRSTS